MQGSKYSSCLSLHDHSCLLPCVSLYVVGKILFWKLKQHYAPSTSLYGQVMHLANYSVEKPLQRYYIY